MDQTGSQQVLEIRVAEISPNPYQPRESFDETSIMGLAASIKEKDLLQPIVVRLKEGQYQLVAGERRLRAHQYLQRETIQAVVREMSDEDAADFALIENLQRENLTLMEEARGLNTLAMRHDGNRQEVARRTGKGVVYVNDRIALVSLPQQVQEHIDKGKINIAQAKVILGLASDDDKIKAANIAIKLNLNANELKGRLQNKLKAKDAGGKPTDRVTYDRLSKTVIQLYDALEGFNYDALRDPAKRNTLKKQLELISKTTESAIAQLQQAVEPEEEKADKPKVVKAPKAGGQAAANQSGPVAVNS